MPLSTSNFKRAMPGPATARYLLCGLLAGFLLVLVAENIIRLAGGTPNVRDTAELWASQRARASALGHNAIIMVGASRIQLGMDLEEIEKISGKKAVQLAIEGSPYLDLLDHLADDAAVKGTILISSGLSKLSESGQNTRVREWVEFYDREFRHLWSPSAEQRLKAVLQSSSALYANIIPLDILGSRLLHKGQITDPYIKTLPSRERNADYFRIDWTHLYIKRIKRNLGFPLPAKKYTNLDEFGRAVIQVAKTQRREFIFNPERYVRIEKALRKIEDRGVKVAIINFPVSGLVEAIEEIRCPQSGWKAVAGHLSATFIDYRDYPQLQFNLADGSHLDMRQKGEFTRRLAAILKDKGVI